MGKSNLYKQFRKAKSDNKRAKVIVEWVDGTMRSLPAVKDVLQHQETIDYMEQALENSQRFLGRPIDGSWALHEDWLKNLLAQGTREGKIQMFFDMLGWEYEFHKSPQYTECTSLLDVGIEGRPCMLLVVSTGHFPEGSIWKNIKSGKQWKILCSDVGEGSVEFEPYGDDNNSKVNLYRSAGSINKFMKKVG